MKATEDIIQSPVALSIAGSDSSAGAGIQMDLRVFASLGVYGSTAITALTAQNPDKVTAVLGIDADFVQAQISAVFERFSVQALKTGMLWSTEIIEVVAQILTRNPSVLSVVDPVMIATSGARLVTDEAIEAYRKNLFPACTLITPNIDEAQVLLDEQQISRENQADAAQKLGEKFGCAVLLKGGHLDGDPVDVLWEKGRVKRWEHPRIMNVNTHGSGCALSAAITAHLALGHELVESIERSLEAIHRALKTPVSPADGLNLAGIENLR